MQQIMLNSDVPKVGQKIILENLARYTYALVHRQYGKSHLGYKLAESELLKKKYLSPLAAIVSPTIVQGRAVYEEKFKNFLAPFKPAISQNKILKFNRPDGQTCRVEWFGSDVFSDSDRGRTTVFNLIDEHGSNPPGFIQQNIFPFGDVHKANNFIIGTTSKGANHFKYEFDNAMRRRAEGDKNYFAFKWTIEDSLKNGEISQKEYDIKRKQYDNEKYEHIWRGEYLMDWFAYSLDQIYAQEVSNAWNMGRVGHFPQVPGLFTDTFWDIGVGGTAVWFVQYHKGRHRFVKFVEAGHKVHFQTFLTQHIIPYQDKYHFRYHVFPQDIKQREFLSKETRYEVAVKMLKAQVVPFKETGHVKSSEMIDYARRNFERCVFDEFECSEGLRRLSAYERNKAGKPVKNEHSHGADAFTYAENWIDKYQVQEDSSRYQRMSLDPKPRKWYKEHKLTKRWWG